jgi:hypothetical protein
LARAGVLVEVNEEEEEEEIFLAPCLGIQFKKYAI